MNEYKAIEDDRVRRIAGLSLSLRTLPRAEAERAICRAAAEITGLTSKVTLLAAADLYEDEAREWDVDEPVFPKAMRRFAELAEEGGQ